MFKFFVPPAIVEESVNFLRCNDQRRAIRELMKQVKRLFNLYSVRPAKRGARYWNRMDSFALYSLCANESLRKSQSDRALLDLERVELVLKQMPTYQVKVYNELVYFLTIMPMRLSIEQFKAKVNDFAREYSDYEIEFLQSLITIAIANRGKDEKEDVKEDAKEKSEAETDDIQTFLQRSVRDVVRRIKSTTHRPELRAVFDRRLQFADELLKHRLHSPPPPLSNLSDPKNGLAQETDAVDSKQKDVAEPVQPTAAVATVDVKASK